MAVHSTILVVEDDVDLSTYLKELLLERSFIVHVANEGARVRHLVEQTQPDLVLMDLGLPDISGETLSEQLKQTNPSLPIIILTAKDHVNDVVRNLNRGADDYVTKPFESEELIARIKAQLRQKKGKTAILKADDLELDTSTIRVTRAGEEIPLTYTEYQLLHYLMANKNRVLTREMILSHVWAYSPDIESRVVDVYIGYLRKKIDKGRKNQLIHSVRGFGYVLKEEKK